MRGGSHKALLGAAAIHSGLLTVSLLAVLSLFSLSDPARADQCGDATSRAAIFCCDRLAAPASSAVPGLKTISPPRCLGEKAKPIVCVDLTEHKVPAEGRKHSTVISQKKAQERRGSQCDTATREAAQVCGANFKLTCPIKATVLGQYPDCAKIRPLIKEIEGNGCSAIAQCVVGEKDAKSSSLPVGSPIDCLQGAIDQKANDTIPPGKFASDGATTKFTSPAPSPSNSVTPTANNPIADFGLDPKALNALGPVFRLEIPGNFVRYQLTNAIYRSVLHNVQKQPIDGVNCDENTLVCQINPLLVVDLASVVNTNTISKYAGFSIVKTAQGYRLTDFWGRLPDVVEAHWKGRIDVDAIENIKINLAASIWQWQPLHDPGNANKGKTGQPYTAQVQPIQHKANYLDRAYVYVGLTGPECKALEDQKLDWSSGSPSFGTKGVALNKHYFTFTTPYSCTCQEPTSTSRNNRNFCVADLFPRQLENPKLTPITGATSPSAPARYEVVCDLDDPQIVLNDPSPGPLMQTTGLSTLRTFKVALGDADIQTIKSTLLNFGCNGAKLDQQKIGPQLAQVLGEQKIDSGNRVTSAIGFFAALNVPLGKYKANYTAGNIEVTVTALVAAERWVEEKVPGIGFIISWIIELVRQVLEAFLSATLTVVMTIPTIFGNSFQVDMNSQPLMLQGLISHTTSATGTADIHVGLKRVASVYSAPKVDTFKVEWTDPTSCQFDTAGGIKGEIASLVGCVAGEMANVAAVALTPLKNLVADGVKDIIFDYDKAISQKMFGVYAQQAAKLEESSDLAKMITSSIQTLAFKPEYMSPNVPGLPNDLTTFLPPFIASVCALAPSADVACALTKAALAGATFPASILAAPPKSLAGFRVLRMGAKTHYRSLQDFGTIFNTDWFYPPVRYCVAGDVPPGSQDYTFNETPKTANTPVGLLASLSDMREIELTMPGDTLIHDFRTQCAGFADVAIRGYLQVSIRAPFTFEVLTAMSLRTMVLFNEVFVCRDNQSCDLNTDITQVMDCAKQSNCNPISQVGAQQPIRLRATAAVCSLMGDIWHRECSGSAAVCNANNVKYQNLLHQAQDAGSTVDKLLGAACPAGSSCAPLKQAVSKISGYAKDCGNIMHNLGWVIPETLAPSDIPPEMFQ